MHRFELRCRSVLAFLYLQHSSSHVPSWGVFEFGLNRYRIAPARNRTPLSALLVKPFFRSVRFLLVTIAVWRDLHSSSERVENVGARSACAPAFGIGATRACQQKRCTDGRVDAIRHVRGRRTPRDAGECAWRDSVRCGSSIRSNIWATTAIE